MNITDIIDKYEPDAFMQKNMQGNRTVSFNGVATADWSVSTLYTRATVEKMLSEVVPEGWKLVPIEPTPGMLSRAKPWLAHWQHMRATDRTNAIEAAYTSMLAAAPSPAKEQS